MTDIVTVANTIDSLVERASATLDCAATAMFAVPGSTFDVTKLQPIEAACKKLRSTWALHSNFAKDLGGASSMKAPPRMDISGEMTTLTEAVESLRSSVDGQLQQWRAEKAASSATTKRMDVRDDRRRVTVAKAAELEELVREALREGAVQLAASCQAAAADKSLASTGENTALEAGDTDDPEDAVAADDAQLRTPIDAREESGVFPFPRTSSLDVATAGQPLAEWLLRVLPSLAKAACGVVYRVADLSHMLLKAAVVMEASAAANELDATLMSMVGTIVGDLSGPGPIGAPVGDVRCCVIQAFVALFVYTVNLDGHYAEPTGGSAPLDSTKAMRLLADVEWKRQRTPENARSGMPKKPAEGDAKFISCTTAAPADKKAFGYNAAPWAVMNWTLRVRADPAASKSVREKADRGARAYHVLTQYIEWALGLLPATHATVTHATVYRGICGRTTRPYVQGMGVVWPAFSSTSTDGGEALKFMGKDRGTYFIVYSATARDVAFASWYPLQAERLLPPGRRFCVQSRVSDTVLTMLESNVELIVMREGTEGSTSSSRSLAPALDDGATAEIALQAVMRTAFVYDSFVSRYVKGRLTSVRGSEAKEHVTDVGEVSDSIASTERDGSTGSTCFVGGSGEGKTSAMLYVLSELARRSGSSASQPVVVPVFVSLPALRLWDEDKQEPTVAPVDAYVTAALGLQTPTQVVALAKLARLVVLLDSLDEVEEGRRAHLHGALRASANPLVASHAAHVIVSTRPEAKSDAERLLGDGHRMLFCLPFTPEDARTLLQRKVAQERLRLKGEKNSAAAIMPDEDALWAQLEGWRAVPQLSNPFVASMCIETLLGSPQHLEASHAALCEPTWQPMADVDIYEAYLRWKLRTTANSSSSSVPGCPRLAVATELALAMTSFGRSHATVEMLGTRIDACREVLRMEAMVGDAFVSFRHKSLQEFLVARVIANELLSGVKRHLSHCSPRCRS